ncbi:S-layer protein [Bacillus cereus]|uniref:S-layer homology domain-containing protein n=1 Tax=Bacillus cereus TaxID=1396 RepID=UPI000BFDF991|nr:S-layer homology domain-containing protein [Bacillus cereus]PGZ09627.1 S-layer protein [Bacillus cereus]
MAKTNSYKKLIAGTMTAAMVAGVVSPVAAAGKSFPDVPEKFWGEESINYLVEKGAVKGNDAGLFEPGKEITRAEAATMMAQILNLPIEENAKPSYPDAQEGWATKYIAAVEKAGVVKGKDNGKFEPNGKIDRVSMASMLVEAYKLDTKVTGTPETKFKDLEDSWGKAKANILVELGISAGTTATTWEPNKTVTKAEAAQFIAKTDKDFGQKSEAKVESIKAINAKEIEVKFGTEVKDVTAANLSIVEGTTERGIKSVELSKDKKSAIVTLNEALENKHAYVTHVTGVKSVDGKDIPKALEVIFFNDEVAPTVSTVSTPDGDVKVVFSEKLSAAEVTVVINGKEFKAMPVDNTVTVSKSAVKDLVKNGEEFNLIVNGAKDLSNNAMSMYQGKATYKVEKDTTAPELKEVKVTDIAADGKVTLEAAFSEELAALNTITVKKGEKTLSVVRNENTDKTKATFTVDGVFEKNENTANLSVEFVGHKDAAGNVGTKTTKTVQVSKDVVAPKFTKVETDGLEAKLVFDKNVASVDAEQLRVINLDTSKKVDVQVAKNPANEKEVTVTFPEKGNYQLFANKGFAVDTSGNKSAAFDTTAKVAEKDVVGKEAPTAKAEFNANKITVDFSKAVKGGQGATSASNLNNYTLDGKKLPEGTIIVLSENGQQATIELPASTKFDATKTVVFTVANVESTDNVKIKNTELLVKVLDNTAPVFQSAKITSVDNKEITLTFSEAVKVDTNDFVLDLNGAPLTVAVKEDKVAKDVVLKVTDAVNLGNGTVTVKAKQGAENTPHVFTTADATGNKLVDFKSVTAAR